MFLTKCHINIYQSSENFEIHYESLEDSSLLTDEASDICIPQVDGANDKKKSNPKPRRGSHASTLPAVAPRRNTRTKSAPEVCAFTKKKTA